MQFFALATAAFLTLTAATRLETRGGKEPEGLLCNPGLLSIPKCCATNVVGVLALDCTDPSPKPLNGGQFKEVCAENGRAPACCAIPILQQCVLANP
ncbi:Cerato-ulmin hydrophobin family [Favolaschia claudopus]|uniref:Cerato-ulmin hydrophobin family n=1 Tax=Favolaschia claudopus TaxID=2862362 RepID=A0AAV9ZX23_9AGAR